ncbi:MAG: alpha-glucosidase/alpha-galactosidase [Candidatus Latescibacterota bacterium]|nr:alpha-glucosidase/alpha-galactosidase [Candidatus Latescibacterota bacterium]
MKPTKIVVVGIGSASFGPKTLGDLLARSELWGSTLSLVDLNEQALTRMTTLASRMNDEWSANLHIQSSTDLCAALPEAEFVICMLEASRDRLWQLDMQIPHKYGVMQVLGENGGPGGLSHTLRTAPLVLEVARAMELHCPNAWLLNYTNPLPRICRAVSKYTEIRVIGFCHGIGGTVKTIAGILDLPQEEIDVKAAGLNHFHWVLDVRLQSTGEDLYPLLRQREAEYRGERQLWSDLFRRFGLMPFSSDDHIGEYLPYMHVAAYDSWQKYGHDHWLLHWDGKTEKRQDLWTRIDQMISGELSVEELRDGSGERAVPVLLAIAGNSNVHELALNLPNGNSISNLPSESIVEVPASVSGHGVTGLQMGELPPVIAAWCANQVQVVELAVDAAVLGDRALALQALLADPVINDIDTAERILDEFLTGHANWLPQFA